MSQAERVKLGWISATIFLSALIYYGILALNFPVLFNIDNYENFAATRYLAEHQKIPVVTADNEDIHFTKLGTTRLLRPPFSFIVSAVVFNTSEEISQDQVSRLRLGSPLIAAFTLVVIFLGFYLAFSRVGLALLGTLIIGTLPRFVFLASCNNDDIGAILSLSFLFTATLALRRYGAKPWVLIVLASAFGLVLSTKYTAWLALPWFIAYIALQLKNDWRRLLSWSPVLALVFIACGGWWIIFNMVNYGINDPSAMSHATHIQSELSDLPPNRRGYQSLGVSALDLLANHDQFVSKSYRSLIGYLEWVELDVGMSTYLFYGVIFTVGLLSVLKLSLAGVRSTPYFEWLLVAIILSQCVFYLHHNWVRDIQPQGRYILPTIMLGIYLFLRVIAQVPNSIASLRLKHKELTGQALVISVLMLISVAVHLNVMLNYIRPAYASEPYFSKLEVGAEYSLENVSMLSPDASLQLDRVSDGVAISRVARGSASIDLTDKFCKMLPINALISIDISSPSAGSLNLRVDSDNSPGFDDVYWQGFAAGRNSVNLPVSAANCSGAQISLGTNTHLLTIHSIKIAELKIHKHGKPI